MRNAFDARAAERIGLLNSAVPQKDLRNKVLELADKLIAKSPNVLKATKQAVRTVRTLDFD